MNPSLPAFTAPNPACAQDRLAPPGRGEDSPASAAALGAHLGLCRALRGRLFSLRCGADALVGFVSRRSVTSALLLAALAALLNQAWR